MKYLLYLHLVLLTTAFIPASGQETLLPVVKETGGRSFYRYPWAGGMNSCQFGSIDLDLDGTDDLLVFDRTGNRILPFINDGISGIISFTFKPEYSVCFPKLYDWVILADYDMDGKKDIFSYSKGFGGIVVYRNISADTLQF